MKICQLPMLKSLCTPKRSRALTAGEKQLAKSVFGDSLPLDDIRLKTAWWVLKGYAVSPNGHIYFHERDFCDDFSTQSLALRAWLVHELTHIWQIEQGIKVVRRALFDRRYRYAFKAGKTFWQYGVEQQAKMVEEYYVRREMGQDCQAWERCIPFLQQADEKS